MLGLEWGLDNNTLGVSTLTAITKEMTIGDILEIDSGTASIFLSYGMHCLGCPSARMESIEEASEVHGIDSTEIVKKLNDYFLENDGTKKVVLK